MEKEKIKVVSKNGLEFERTKKTMNYDKRVTMRMNSEKVELAKEKADKMGISFYELIRQGMDYMIEKELENENK